RRNGSEQWRRSDFSQGTAGGHGEQGKSGKRNVSEHQGEGCGGPEPAGGSAGSDREAGAGASGSRRRRQGACGGYSGAAVAFGAGQAGGGGGNGSSGERRTRCCYGGVGRQREAAGYGVRQTTDGGWDRRNFAENYERRCGA